MNILLLLFAAFAVRALLTAVFPSIVIENDSEDYYLIGRAITSAPMMDHIVNPNRTPIYPIITSLLISYNSTPIRIHSDAFINGAQALLTAQMILGIMASLLWYKALLLASIPRRTAFVCSLICIGNVTIALWERRLMSEGIGITWLVIQTYIYLKTLRLPSNNLFLACWLASIIGLLIRPAFIFAPFLSLLIIGLFHNSSKIWIRTCVTLVCILVIPLIYIYINSTLHGYMGISYFGDINLLGIIMQNNIPMQAGSAHTHIYNGIKEYYASGGDAYVFRFILHYDPAIFTNIPKINELQAFVKTILWTHADLYMWSSLASIPKIFMYNAPIDIPQQEYPMAIFFFRNLERLYDTLKYGLVAIFPISVLHIYNFFQRKNYDQAALLLIGGIAITQVITTAFFVYEADPVYKRMLSPILYHMITYVYCWGIALNSQFKQKKLRAKSIPLNT